MQTCNADITKKQYRLRTVNVHRTNVKQGLKCNTFMEPRRTAFLDYSIERLAQSDSRRSAIKTGGRTSTSDQTLKSSYGFCQDNQQPTGQLNGVFWLPSYINRSDRCSRTVKSEHNLCRLILIVDVLFQTYSIYVMLNSARVCSLQLNGVHRLPDYVLELYVMQQRYVIRHPTQVRTIMAGDHNDSVRRHEESARTAIHVENQQVHVVGDPKSVNLFFPFATNM